MNTETGAISPYFKLSKDDREARNRRGNPLWVPMTRENLSQIESPDARARILKAIEKRERRAAKRAKGAA